MSYELQFSVYNNLKMYSETNSPFPIIPMYKIISCNSLNQNLLFVYEFFKYS